MVLVKSVEVNEKKNDISIVNKMICNFCTVPKNASHKLFLTILTGIQQVCIRIDCVLFMMLHCLGVVIFRLFKRRRIYDLKFKK